MYWRTDLKVSDDGVPLAAEVDEVGVGVVEREHDAVAGVDLHRDDGLGQRVRRAQAVLPLRHAAEAGRDEFIL